jgi:hypothetical protein
MDDKRQAQMDIEIAAMLAKVDQHQFELRQVSAHQAALADLAMCKLNPLKVPPPITRA